MDDTDAGHKAAEARLAARITAADLPPEGPVMVVCLTCPTLEERRRLCDLLKAAMEPGMLLALRVVRDESEVVVQEVLAL